MSETIDKILEKLPYSDGSLRRRFVSGGIVIVGALVISLILYSYKEEPLFIAKIKQIFESTKPTDIFTSPILLGIAVLSVYALGNLVEMFGEIFLVRAAAGMFWAMSFPIRNPGEHDGQRSINNGIFILKICAVPFLIIFNVGKGLFGYTSYETEIRSSLTTKAKNYYDKKIKKESKVDAGIACPVGNHAETTWKYLVDLYTNDGDKMWARRSIGRVKDVLAITTALIIVIISISVVVSLIMPIPQPPGYGLEYEKDLMDRMRMTEILKYIKDERKKEQIINTIISEIKNPKTPERELATEINTAILEALEESKEEYTNSLRKIEEDIKNINEDTQTAALLEDGKRHIQRTIDKVSDIRYMVISAIPGELSNIEKSARVYLEGDRAKYSIAENHNRKVEYIQRFAWVFAIVLLFMYIYQAYFLTQKNVIESLIEILAIKEEDKTKYITRSHIDT